MGKFRPSLPSGLFLQHLVELVAELEFQVFDIVVGGVEVPELTQFFLKCPQGVEVFLPRVCRS